MRNLKNKSAADFLSHWDPQLFCLALAGIMEFFFIVLGVTAYGFLDHYAVVPCMLFAGTALMQKKSPAARRQLLLGTAVFLWFFLLQTIRTAETNYAFNPGLFASAYLLAFPFATLTKDGQRQKGLTLVGGIYLAASLIYTGFAFLLLIDHVPYFLEDAIFWDGARLRIMWHPNVCASIFMIGIAFSLGFFFRAKQKWLKALLLAAVAVQFIAAALTNSRTSVLMICALIGGVVCFCIYKGRFKQLLAGITAALVVMVSLFLAANAIFKTHNRVLVAKYAAEAAASAAVEIMPVEVPAAETPVEEMAAETAMSTAAAETEAAPAEEAAEEPAVLQGVNGQGSFWQDLLTFNNRTVIWGSALRAVRNDPMLLLLGTSHTGNTTSAAGPFTVQHTHNSWLEVLLGLGLPGFAAAMIYTVIALRSALFLLFKTNADMGKKTIAILSLGLMAAAMMEPYLFYADRFFPFFDFMFFLCVGYMAQWYGDAKPKPADDN